MKTHIIVSFNNFVLFLNAGVEAVDCQFSFLVYLLSCDLVG